MSLGTAGDPDAHREAGQLTQGSSVLLCWLSSGTQAKPFAQPFPMQRTAPCLLARLPEMDRWDKGRQG